MRPNIVLFGDSIAQQSFRSGGWGASLADTYSRKFKHNCCTRYYVLVLDLSFSSQDSKKPPVATIIFFGVNDAALLGRNGERQHVPVEKYKENLRKIVNHLKVQFYLFTTIFKQPF
ncbi:hypothetical protein CRYUN_Cryun12cG0135100 [Craigia yunnanensis]